MAATTASPETPPFQDRRTGLIVFGVLEIVLGGLCVLLVPVSFLAQKLQAEMIGQAPAYRTAVPGALFYLALAVTFVALGIGSIRCRRWAQTLTLFVAWTWLLTGVFSMVGLAFTLPGLMAGASDSPALGIGIAIALAGVVLVVFILLPGSMVLFYRSPHVRATCEARDPVVRWTDACPLPVLGGSLSFALCAVSCVVMPLSGQAVVPLFGKLVTGPAAYGLLVVVGAVCVWLAWGIYRMSTAAWLGSIAMTMLLGVSTTITFMRVEVTDLYRALGYPEQQIEQIAELGLFTGTTMAVWMAISFVAVIAYMLWIKRYFRPQV